LLLLLLFLLLLVLLLLLLGFRSTRRAHGCSLLLLGLLYVDQQDGLHLRLLHGLLH
jgi:hypothetical protein